LHLIVGSAAGSAVCVVISNWLAKFLGGWRKEKAEGAGERSIMSLDSIGLGVDLWGMLRVEVNKLALTRFDVARTGCKS
jgi:hypothetical protein